MCCEPCCVWICVSLVVHVVALITCSHFHHIRTQHTPPHLLSIHYGVTFCMCMDFSFPFWVQRLKVLFYHSLLCPDSYYANLSIRFYVWEHGCVWMYALRQLFIFLKNNFHSSFPPVRSQHYLKLPVQFKPSTAGRHAGLLLIQSETSGSLVIQLTGEALPWLHHLPSCATLLCWLGGCSSLCYTSWHKKRVTEGKRQNCKLLGIK